MSFPELYTPAEVAEKLKLFKGDGTPNARLVKDKCFDGDMDFIEISYNNIRITEHALLKYMEAKTCPEERIRGNTLNSARKGRAGKLSNTLPESLSATQLAMAALKKQKESLPNSSSNIISLKNGTME